MTHTTLPKRMHQPLPLPPVRPRCRYYTPWELVHDMAQYCIEFIFEDDDADAADDCFRQIVYSGPWTRSGASSEAGVDTDGVTSKATAGDLQRSHSTPPPIKLLANLRS
jgi:hypothetical protein